MRKLTSILATAAISAASLALAVPQASAVITPKAMTVSPVSGAKESAINLATAGQCASGNRIQVLITGTGIPINGYGMTGKDDVASKAQGANYYLPLLESLSDAAAAQSPAATLSGVYTFSANCYQGNFGTTVLDAFEAKIYITNADTKAWASVTTTTTAIQVSKRLLDSGETVLLTATVSAAAATGAVEFFATPVAGGLPTLLGSGVVNGGVATLSTSALAPGALAGEYAYYNISATFTPTSNAYTGSTSSTVKVGVLRAPTDGVAVINPASGTSSNTVSVRTTATCPAGNNRKVQVTMFGAGFPTEGYNMTGNDSLESKATPGGLELPLLQTLAAAAADQTPPATLDGEYDFVVICRTGIFADPTAILGVAPLWFTSSTVFQTVEPVNSTSTTTAIEASKRLLAVGESVLFTATVSETAAAGSVQFYKTPAAGGDTTALGSPQAVTNGIATFSTSSLTEGTLPGEYAYYNISAIFTPTSNAYTGSTSSTVKVGVLRAPTEGVATISPASGTPTSVVRVDTTNTCPTGNNRKIQVTMFGSGFPVNGYNITGNDSLESKVKQGGLELPLLQTLAAAAADQTPPATLNGEYQFKVFCRVGVLSDPTAILGVAKLWFTSPTAYQTEDPASSGTQTSVTLGIDPTIGVYEGDEVTFTATLSPSNATGEVTFFATATTPGATPITLGTGQVSAGVATFTDSSLPGAALSGVPKAYKVKAVFTPSSDSFLASESDESTLNIYGKIVPVNNVAPSLGSPKVGSAVTCSAGTWLDASTYKFTLKVANVEVKQISGSATSTTYTPTAADRNKQLTCSVEATATGGGKATASATAKTIALGTAITPLSGKSPVVSGTMKVGQTVKVTTGTWSKTGAAYTYQWVTMVGSKATNIANAKASSFKIPATLKGKTIGVIVTATVTGYLPGIVTIKANKAVVA